MSQEVRPMQKVEILLKAQGCLKRGLASSRPILRIPIGGMG